jgi:hypothetical protein
MPRLFRHNVRPIIMSSACRNMWPSVRCNDTDCCMLKYNLGAPAHKLHHMPRLFRHNVQKLKYNLVIWPNIFSSGPKIVPHAEIISAHFPVLSYPSGMPTYVIHMSSAKHCMLNNFLHSGLTIKAYAEIIAQHCLVVNHIYAMLHAIIKLSYCISIHM